MSGGLTNLLKLLVDILIRLLLMSHTQCTAAATGADVEEVQYRLRRLVYGGHGGM